MQQLIAPAMRKQSPEQSVEDVKAKHTYRFVNAWPQQHAVHALVARFYEAVLPHARDFCVDRRMTTAAKFNSVWDNKVCFTTCPSLCYLCTFLEE